MNDNVIAYIIFAAIGFLFFGILGALVGMGIAYMLIKRQENKEVKE